MTTRLNNSKKYRTFYEEHYKEVHSSVDQNIVDRRFEMLRPFLDRLSLEGKIVIDLGCGLGKMLEKVTNCYKCIPIAADISFKTLSAIEHDYPKIQSDAEFLPIKKARAELIFSIDLLEHLPSPDNFLKNITGQSRNLLMFIPMESTLLDNIIYRYRRLFGKQTTRERYGHLSRFSKKKLITLLNKTGHRKYHYKIVLNNDMAKYTSFFGKCLSLSSKLCYRVSKTLHKALFAEYAFIVICNFED